MPSPTRPRPTARRPTPHPRRRLRRPPAAATAPRPRAAAARPAPAIERLRLPGIPVKKYLLAGLLVWLPLAITIWVLHAILGLLDGVFEALLTASQAVLPNAAHYPIEVLKRIPGLGVIVMFVGLLLTGVFAANMAGQWALRQGSRILSHIAIVKSIYSSVKQVSDTLFSSSGSVFREAVLVQYPREGSWTIAFVTGKPGGEA